MLGSSLRGRQEAVVRPALISAALFVSGILGPLVGQSPLSMWDQAEPVYEVGTLDGPDVQVFGRIRDVEVDSVGNLFILDDQALTVSWFDETGTFRGRAGRAGGGPGEFRAPMALAVDSTGDLHVLDQAHARMTILGLDGDSISLKRTIGLPGIVWAHDFCIIGGEYYVFGPQEWGSIHRVNMRGERISSFGPLTEAGAAEVQYDAIPTPNISQVLRDNINRGRMACTVDDAGEPLLVLSYEVLPVVRAFRTTGEAAWSVRLADFNPIQFTVTREGHRLIRGALRATVHTGATVAEFGVGTVAVSLRETSMSDREGRTEVRFLSSDDGEEVGRSTGSLLVGASRGLSIYGYRNLPYPKITVFLTFRTRPNDRPPSTR